MAPVMSGGSPQPQTLEGDGPGEVTNSTNHAAAPSQSPRAREEVELTEDIFLPLKKFSRMQVLSCIVQIETKTFIECTSKGCLYISLTVWDMAYHLPNCEGSKGNDKLKKCRYCPHGTLNMDALNNHMILSHSYAPEVLDKKNKLEFVDVRQEEREAFLTSPFAREIVRTQWRICLQTKGYIICLTQTCRFVTSLIPVMEDHYIRCSPQIWENLKFTCDKCPGKTFSKDALDDHAEECHSSQNLTFNTVQPEAKRFWELSLALYSITKCVSLHCKFIASNINELERHYRYCRVPHAENYEVCEYCGGWCDTSDDKIQHIAAMHSRVRNNDESIETLKALEHMEVMKKLMNLDLNSANFPWVKVMSYGGETVLNRLVEGIEEPPRARNPKSRAKNKNNALPGPEAETPPVPKKVVVKKEKHDNKRAVLARRKSSRASDIDTDVSLHAIKAEELFIPDKTFLEDLGQAIEVECLETPKVEFQVSVGDLSWTVEAPNLETASEVITRKMPSYSMKSVLAQSIEDSLNLLKIEANVSSIENLSTKPYVPPKALRFATKPNVLESLKKKFDLIRQREVKEKNTDSFMTGDSFSGIHEIVEAPQKPAEIPKKKSKRKEFRAGVRPWQSLARIKQKPAPESESEASSNEDVLPEISFTEEGSESPCKPKCKILLPKKKRPSESVESAGDGSTSNLNEKEKDVPAASKSGRRAPCRKQKKLTAVLCDDDSTKMVRDVSIQHGSSAFPVFSEQLINSRYNRATLLIGYPYSMLKPSLIRVNVEVSTQTTTRNYSGRPQILNQKPPTFKMVPGNQLPQSVVVSSPYSFSLPGLPGSSQKRLVVLSTMAPVDSSITAGPQTVFKNLSRVGANGAVGVPQLVRFVNAPISKVLSNSSPTGSPIPIPTTLVRCKAPLPSTLIRCSAPTMVMKNGSQIIKMLPSASCTVTAGSNMKPAVSSVYATKSIPNSPSSTISVIPSDVKTESMDTVSIENPNNTPIVSVDTSSAAASTASAVYSSPLPTASIASASAASTAFVSSSASPTASVVAPSVVTTDVVMSSSAVPSSLPGTLDISASPPSSVADPSSGYGLGKSIATTCDRPVVTVATSNEVSGAPAMFPVSGGFSNAIAASPSSDSSSPLNKTRNLKTYSHSPKLRRALQVAKKPRIDTISPLEAWSKEIPRPEEDPMSRITFNVPPNESTLVEVNPISDYVSERKPEKSRFTSASKTYLKEGSSVQIGCSFYEESSYSCCSRDPIEENPPTDDQYSIFYETYYDDGNPCASSSIKVESKPSTSKDDSALRNHEFDDYDSIIFCGESQTTGNSLDPSIPFELFFDSSTDARGGLYNEKCPWEGKKPSVPPTIEKTNLGNSSGAACQQTTLHMEVDEDPVRIPGLKKESTEVCHCDSGSIKEEMVEMVEMVEDCIDAGCPDSSVSCNSEQVNELANYLTDHKGVQVQNEPMVYASNQILLDQPNALSRQVNLYFESMNGNGERRRLEELVHYLTHYNMLQVTNNDPIVCIANKISHSAPSTSNSDKGPQGANKGRRSLQSKKGDATESEKMTKTENSGVSEKSRDQGDKKARNKRLRKSATVASNPENQSDSEETKAAVDSTASSVQEMSVQAPAKKRGRKLKVNQEEFTLTEEVSEALANTRLDVASENGQGGSKTLPPKKAGRKSKTSVATGNNIVEDGKTGAQESITNSMDEGVEQSKAEVEKPKASGKKPKNAAIKPTDVLLEMEVEAGDDHDVPQTSTGRRGRYLPKKSLDPVEKEEEILGPFDSPPKPKKRGRPPKVVEPECAPEQPEDDNGKRFLYHDDVETDGELVPAFDRIIFNSTLPNPNKMVTCAICNITMTAKVYKINHLYKHNHVCWLTNEEPMDLNDELTLERHLYKVYCHLRKPFHCEVCGKAVKSARGFISHKKFCGKTMQERQEKMVACSVCSRLLKPSSYSQHVMNHHTPVARPSEVKEEPTELQTRAARSLERRSSKVLERRSPKVKDVTASGGPVHIDEDEEKSQADSQPWIRHNYALEKRRITHTIRALFNTLIEKEGIARCLNPGCDKKDVNMKRVIEHYRTCDTVPLDFKCKVCAHMEGNEHIMIHHVRTSHLEKSLDLERKILRGEDAAGETTEFSGKFLPYLKAAEGASRSLLFLQPALLWTYKMKNEFIAPGCIFPEFSVDDSLNTFEDYPPSHFELREKSMGFALHGPSPVWMTLTKLTSFRDASDTMIMYTGGIVRSLDWFPSEREQYLIVAVGSIDSESINVKSTKTGPGHLQIWSAEHLNNYVARPDNPVTFQFAFCHDFGEVWDLQCCPGGEPEEKRLGLVALATSSGKVVVYAVPSIPFSVPNETHRATKPEPTLLLETGLHESFQVSKVAWSKVKPHRFIAGGFTNGMVAVWDLTTTSILLRSGNTILPFKMFHPHFVTITGLSFSPVHEFFIVTSCADKSCKFFNLEDTSVSHVEYNRGLFMDAAWLTHWMSAVAAIDDNTTLGTTTAMIHPLRNFIYQAHPSITQPESCCLSVSVNDWMNGFANSYDSGQVLLTFARKHIHMLDDRKRGHAQLITPQFHNFNPTSEEMIDCQSYAATSENFGIIFNCDFSATPSTKLRPVPLSDVTYFPSTAANKVCWNPNTNSFLTLAVGYHSGFVILGRIKLHPTELADVKLLMSEISKSDEPAPCGSPRQGGSTDA